MSPWVVIEWSLTQLLALVLQYSFSFCLANQRVPNLKLSFLLLQFQFACHSISLLNYKYHCLDQYFVYLNQCSHTDVFRQQEPADQN